MRVTKDRSAVAGGAVICRATRPLVCLLTAGSLVTIAGCGTPPTGQAEPAVGAEPPAIPVCGDARGATVVKDSEASATRTVQSFARNGKELWAASPVGDPFPVPVDRCDTQVLSSSLSGWSDPSIADPTATVYSPDSPPTTWPGQAGYVKYRVLAATDLGTGIVATGEGGAVTVRLQADGEYIHSERMHTGDMVWGISPDGQTGVAYDYRHESGQLVFFEMEEGEWVAADVVAIGEPVYTVYVDSPERYLVRTAEGFVLHSRDRAERLAGADEFSDAYLTNKFVALFSRRSFGDGSLRTDVRVINGQRQSIFERTYRSLVIASAGKGGAELVLSAPGVGITVAQDRIRHVHVGHSAYVVAGQGGVYVVSNADGVRVTRMLSYTD